MPTSEGSGTTPFRQVMADIREQIASGRLAVGDRLPSLKSLCDTYSVSYGTMRRAVEELTDQGILSSQWGRGTFVARAPHLVRLGSNRYRRTTERVSPAASEMRINGDDFTLTGAADTCPAEPGIAARLGINDDDPVSRVHYCWTSTDGEPIQCSTQYEPLALTRGTTAEHPPESGVPDVISRFDDIGYHCDHVTETLRTRMPTAAETTELAVPGGVPVLYMQRTHYAGDTALETAEITIRGDRMVVSTTHPVTS